MDDLKRGCRHYSDVASDNRDGKGKAPRTPFTDLTNLTNCSSLKSSFDAIHSDHRGAVSANVSKKVNIIVSTKKGLAAACADCVSRSPGSIDLFHKANVHLPSRGLFSSENNNVNSTATPLQSCLSDDIQRFNTKPNSSVQPKRRKAADDEHNVHPQQIFKPRGKKSKLHMAKDLSCFTTNIPGNQTYPVHASVLSTHLDDGESSFIADDQMCDHFITDHAVPGKRREPADDQLGVHSQQMPKQRTNKSKLHVAEDLSCITRNILTNQTNPLDDSVLCTHLDDGESSFIADHQVYDDFLGDDDYSEHDEEFNSRYDKNLKPVPEGYGFLGPPTGKCVKCQSIMWPEERSNKGVKKALFKYTICCGNGKVKLPPAPRTPSYLWQLYNDPIKGPHFHRNTRVYNTMFAFTSTGGNVDTSINRGGSPYIYKLNGQTITFLVP
ncbi:uncharacterized protein LOC108198379 isoform X3 [Daucus carota subsp. sativus]|uniref:uncharacterized protein LOC108198379 isoform X3 n=1 Tax=Daucus carota subsp. sativus TaxID=79200 RepID=UPI0030830082